MLKFWDRMTCSKVYRYMLASFSEQKTQAATSSTMLVYIYQHIYENAYIISEKVIKISLHIQNVVIKSYCNPNQQKYN